MKKNNSCLLIISFVLYGFTLAAQENSYLVTGWSFEKFNNVDVFNTIIDDFNTHHSTNGNTLSEPLNEPGMLNGIFLGFKLQDEDITIGLNLQAHKFKNTARGIDSNNVGVIKQMQVTHHGFSMHGGWNIIGKEMFRTGPMICLNFEQFRSKVHDSDKSIIADGFLTTDVFYFSPSFKWNISFGGEHFNFDIIPYYQLPLYKMNLTKLNNKLNEGYATPYAKADMKQSPKSLGLIVTLNFGMDH